VCRETTEGRRREEETEEKTEEKTGEQTRGSGQMSLEGWR